MKKLMLSVIVSCISLVSFAFCPPLGVITGTFSVCIGDSTTLADATPGGTWSSSTPAIATVGSTGIVYGVTAGVDTIFYNAGASGIAYQTVTVNPNPGMIHEAISTSLSSIITVCAGSSVLLADAPAGGTWSSGNSAVGTMGGASLYGIIPGTTLITYTLPTGCIATHIASVDPIPGPMTGTMSVCAGATTTLSCTPTGGTWLSGSTAIATVLSGVVTGVSGGTANISYTLAGCRAIATVTVVAAPGPIMGASTICAGSSTTYIDGVTGGTWSSSATSVATIDPVSGSLTSVSPGTSTITYTVGSGCFVTLPITVIPVPTYSPISGPTSVCAGSAITLTDAPIGGTWSAASSAVATISPAGTLTGVSFGVAGVTYSLGSGCGMATTTVAVDPAPAAISGGTSSSVCIGSVIALSDAVADGTWSSSNTAVAIVGGTGSVTTLSAGTTTVDYTLPGGCFVSTAIIVISGPAAIGGSGSVCAGASITLTDGTTGGTWSSSLPATATIDASTGAVSGVAAGATTVTYSLAAGCSVTTVVTVNPIPVITGPATVCVGLTFTLNATPAGGAWSSGTTSAATIGASTGIITGATAGGTTTITYTAAGCIATTTVTVSTTPCSTGFNEAITTNDNVAVYPNPAYDELTIKTNAGEFHSFIITNETGQVMMRSQLTSVQTTADIKALPSGLYYIILKGDAGNTIRKFAKM